ncbi:MAG TPA: hypothetical protein VGQ52_10205 [Gemmatimonadaceae bacterium]|nr:hypothetical protein [Gemmatimonadaceae bacterium]
MPREDLVNEINRANRSRFQGDSYAYLKTRLAVLDEEAERQHQEKHIEVAEEGNRIAVDANVLAGEANAIAREASATAKKAYWISGASLVAALLALLVQCTGKS